MATKCVLLNVLLLNIIGLAVIQGDIPFPHDFKPVAGTGAKFMFGDGSNTKPDRPGDATETHSCHTITRVPAALTFITRFNYYYKYTEAYGIPIVSSNRVHDAALTRACYVLRFLLGDRRIFRHYLYKYYGRIGIMASTEVTTDIPEHKFLGHWWDTRARGLGGTIALPISTGAEENILCYPNDRYHREDIFLHEFSHGIQEISVRGGGIPGFFERLKAQYAYAKRTGLWRNTYAMSTVQEYFAEGVQSFFNVNDYANPPNGIHGPISTRPKLKVYDPVLYKMIVEVFPCQNYILDRCTKPQVIPQFKMNCDGDGHETTGQPPVSGKPTPATTEHPVTKQPVTTVNTDTGTPIQPLTVTQVTKQPPPVTTGSPQTTKSKVMVCKDDNKYCSSWAQEGYCAPKMGHTKYMMEHCTQSCGCCTNKSPNVCDKFVSRGYCEKTQQYRAWMELNCKKSCKICQEIISGGGN